MRDDIQENAGTPRWPQCDILGIRFDLIDYEKVFEIIQVWRKRNERHFMISSNPHDVHLSRNDDVRRASAKASLTLPDGIGIIIAATILGYKHHGRVTASDLMLKLCDWDRQYGYRHYFYGSTKEVVKKLIERLTEKYPGLEVAGTYCPPFRPLTQEEDEAIVEEINSTHPDIVWVGLGAPKQQLWMADHLGRINATVMYGVGAVFNFHSGVVKWAPAWVRRMGMEGIYRAIQEPRKIVPRYRHAILFGLRVIWYAFVRHRRVL